MTRGRSPSCWRCLPWRRLYWTLHPYIEHADTGTSHYDNARDCTSPVLRFLLLSYTSHHCHHLYPNVPAYRLSALRRHLEGTGYLVGYRCRGRYWGHYGSA